MSRYDYILIDCPPSLNMLTLNALTASDAVFIPIQCEYYALEGLSALLETVGHIREAVNPELEIEGLLRTMFDARNNLANEVSEQLLEHFGDKVYRTIIPRNITFGGGAQLWCADIKVRQDITWRHCLPGAGS